MYEVIKNKRGLELVSRRSSGYEKSLLVIRKIPLLVIY